MASEEPSPNKTHSPSLNPSVLPQTPDRSDQENESEPYSQTTKLHSECLPTNNASQSIESKFTAGTFSEQQSPQHRLTPHEESSETKAHRRKRIPFNGQNKPCPIAMKSDIDANLIDKAKSPQPFYPQRQLHRPFMKDHENFPLHGGTIGWNRQAPIFNSTIGVNGLHNPFSNAHYGGNFAQTVNGQTESPPCSSYTGPGNHMVEQNFQHPDRYGVPTHFARPSLPTSHERTQVVPYQPQPQPQERSLGSPFPMSSMMTSQRMARSNCNNATLPHFHDQFRDWEGPEMPLKKFGLPPRQPNFNTQVSLVIGHPYPTNLTDIDKKYVQFLVNAMMDMKDADDNLSMQDTWKKMSKQKPDRVKQVCAQLLALVDQTTLTNEPLTSKKPMYPYPTMADRLMSLDHMLRTQKTVCKHLLEEPYICQVVDDPTQATKRVVNNRRVNDQKSKTIKVGRKALGFDTSGKGARLGNHTTLKEEREDTAEYSAPLSDAETEYEAPSPRKLPKRAATKRRYKDVDEGDGQVEASSLPTPPKRQRRNAARKRMPPPVPAIDTKVSGSSINASNEASTDSPANGNFFSARSTPPHDTGLPQGSNMHHGLSIMNAHTPPYTNGASWEFSTPQSNYNFSPQFMQNCGTFSEDLQSYNEVNPLGIYSDEAGDDHDFE